MKNLKLLSITLLLLLGSARLNAQITDTLKKDSAENLLALPDTVKHLQSKFISFIPPIAFVSYGLLSFKVKAIRNIDYSVYNDMAEDHPNFSTQVENYLRNYPGL